MEKDKSLYNQLSPDFWRYALEPQIKTGTPFGIPSIFFRVQISRPADTGTKMAQR